MRAARTVQAKPSVPPAHDWRTTDADEINKRRQRAREESCRIVNTTPAHPIFSNFRVDSASGQSYSVEIRDLRSGQYGCTCVDFRINGLGFCKHVEAVRLHLHARQKKLFKAAEKQASGRIEVALDAAGGTLRVRHDGTQLPAAVRKWFRADGLLIEAEPERAVEELRRLSETRLPRLRVSQEIEPWLENRRLMAERRRLRHEYELKVQSGEWPAQETTVPLFPYQREGMLHLAFTERALLADEMGLGKTIQAIAACALLHRQGQARRALIVTPASLKTEWEDQIRKFTPLAYRIVYGGKAQRLSAYSAGPGAAVAGDFHSSPSSITSRSFRTPWTSTRASLPTLSFWMKRSGSRTGAPKRPRP